MYEEAQYFYGGYYVYQYTAAKSAQLKDYLDKLQIDELEQLDQNEIFEEFKIEPIILHLEDVERTVEDGEIDLTGHPGYMRSLTGERNIRKCKYHFYHIPYSGLSELFLLRTSTFTTVLPTGYVDTVNRELIIKVDDSDGIKEIERKYKQKLSDFETYIGYSKMQVDAYNRQLPGQITNIIENRKAALKKEKEELDKANLPPLRKPKGTSNVLPIKIRPPLVTKIKVEQTSNDPVLSIEALDSIIRMIQNIGEMMEQSGGTYNQMEEESLRDVILTSLANTGLSVSGETFNRNGKTDIMIKHGIKNIFIAECKKWKGPEYFKEGLDQLLGYTLWRDAKVAMIIFNYSKDMTKRMQDTKNLIEKREDYVWTCKDISPSISRYIMKHPQDSEKNLTLTVMFLDLSI